MELDPLDVEQDANDGPLPSDAEVNKLLQDSPTQPQGSPLTDQESSPTAAIRTALEARVMEELGEFGRSTIKPPLPLSTSECGGVKPSNGNDITCAGAGGNVQVAAESCAVGSLDLMHADSALVKTQPINTNPKIPDGTS